jgi:hypothetical protein
MAEDTPAVNPTKMAEETTIVRTAAVDPQKEMRMRLNALQRARSGQKALNEPREEDKIAMKQAFSTAPKNRKMRDYFTKKLNPEEYLVYLETEKNNQGPKKVYRRPKAHKMQSKPSTVVDVETQQERPAFVSPILRPMPNKSSKTSK